ncbi:MAG: response regulator [SAR324 cluster bacterium]|nr:response regulator [SAR324 cluster bacterium]
MKLQTKIVIMVIFPALILIGAFSFIGYDTVKPILYQAQKDHLHLHMEHLIQNVLEAAQHAFLADKKAKDLLPEYQHETILEFVRGMELNKYDHLFVFDLPTLSLVFEYKGDPASKSIVPVQKAIAEIREAIQSQREHINLEGSDHVIFTGNFDPWNWKVVLLSDTQALIEPLNQRIFNMMVLCALVTMILMLGMLFLSKKIILNPIIIIQGITKKIAGNEIVYGVPITSKDEIGDLARDIESMANSIQKYKNLLTNENDKLQQIIEDLPVNIFIKNIQGQLLLCNEALANTLQRPKSEIINKTDDELFAPDVAIRHRQHDMTVWKAKELIMREEHFTSPEKKWFLAGKKILTFKDGESVLLGFSVDMTQQKITEKLLAEEKKRAEEASQAKMQFLAKMSHEIRSPLNAISGFSQLLEKKYGAVIHTSDFKRYLRQIQDSSVHLAEIISNILELAQLQSGKAKVELKPVNIRLLFQGIFHLYKAQAHEKNLTFEYSFDPQLPVMILSDRTFLNHILHSLVDNAIKFTSKGSVQMKAFEHNKMLCWTIEDSGVGISTEHLKTIFHPFEQADNTITRKYGGTGLGLTLVKSMIELLEGSIIVESALDHGSVFTVMLPLQAVSEHPEETPSHQPSQENVLHGKHILMAEDNPVNQLMMQAIFEDIPCQLVVTANGEEALNYCRETRPDIILMDIHMPVMDGFTATRLIRQLPTCEQIPIIGISAESFKEQELNALNAGMSAYLTKPVKVDEVLSIISKYFSSDTTPANQTETTTLGSEVLEQIKAICQNLLEIPYFMTDKIHKKLQELNELLVGTNHPLKKSLSEMEQALSSRNNEKLTELVNEILHGKNINR